MKNEIRMALLLLASSSVPAFAQDATPNCSSFFDSTRSMFTAQSAPVGAPNVQCFFTVMPKDGPNSLAGFPQLSQYPNPQLQEGTYAIELSGGGGGGGGGGDRVTTRRTGATAGTEGGAATVARSEQYLTPGVYKLTIGTGGFGGDGGEGRNSSVQPARGTDGNPTSITRAYTNELVAGYQGADTRGAQRVSSTLDYDATHNTGASSTGGSSTRNGDDGNMGGPGFVSLKPIQIAQATPPAPRAVAAAPAFVAPAPAYVAPAPAYVAPARAAKQDRN
jgi:hypothetical protein